MRIYIIDDDQVYLMGIKRIISRNTIDNEIDFFENGQVAYDALLKNIHNHGVLPDLILLDINMPVMDGWEFLDEFSKIKPQLNKKIIIYMVSSSINPVDMNRAKNYEDVYEYVQKPINIDDLKRMISSVS